MNTNVCLCTFFFKSVPCFIEGDPVRSTQKICYIARRQKRLLYKGAFFIKNHNKRDI